MASLPMDDKDLDDAALWAVIDSAAAAYSSSTTTTNSTSTSSSLKLSPPFKSPPKPRTFTSPFSSPNSTTKSSSSTPKPLISPSYDHDYRNFNRPHKFPRSSPSEITERSSSSPNLMIINKFPVNQSPKANYCSPKVENSSPQWEYGGYGDEKENFGSHCLAARFPTVSLFKEYQDAAMSILEKSDYTVISGNPFIKKSGWRKIAFYFNVSFEIRDKTIEFDDNRNVQRAEFVARAYMHGGRFSDGWGSCERREKKFMKPNNDIPSTAETRAKNRACQDPTRVAA